ncbi:hypothetical protein SAMN05216184_101736 [Georgenia satyanarayanai]|uniref:Uncharacterized protein n=1 Tax=Georgenia satyanarayanai TaxID=860221 RepID=A0A2Y8ZZU3_9MICO|nr:hypothetical protein A8987_101736 [Georgenia satyanarayanai]SSA37116.1 hypothetical protein SAMN05216184_101736 [Georgenia satyanarayanai]
MEDAVETLKQSLRVLDLGGAQRALGALTAAAPAALSSSAPAALEQVAKAVPLVRQAESVALDPEGAVDEVLGPVARGLDDSPELAMTIIHDRPEAGAEPAASVVATAPPAETGDLTTDVPARGTAGMADVWAGIRESVVQKWHNLDVAAILRDIVVTAIWPWPTVLAQLHQLWTDWATAVDDLYVPASPLTDPVGFLRDVGANLSHLLELPLALYRHLTAIGLSLMGWVTIGLMLVGGFGGSVAGTVLGALAGALATLGIGAGAGGAAGAAGGGWTGAGVGTGVAMGIGQALLVAFVVGEGAALGKALTELLVHRQTPQEQTRDYNQVADSGLVLAFLVPLAAAGWFGASFARRAMASFVRVLPAPVRRAAEKVREGIGQVREGPGRERSPDQQTPEEKPPPTPVPATARRRLSVEELRGLWQRKERVLVWKTRNQDIAANQDIKANPDLATKPNPTAPDRIHMYQSIEGAPQSYGDQCVLLTLEEAQQLGFRPLGRAFAIDAFEWVWDYGVLPPNVGTWFTLDDLAASGYKVTGR